MNAALPPLVNILLVDDRPEGLISLEAILHSPEYNLVKAGSGQEALRCLLDDDFALILLDVQMPDLDGLETAAIIKMRERCKDVPIIFVTAINRDEQHVYRAYETGAVDYVFKPIDPVILKCKVGAFVDIYRKNLEIRKQTELLRQSERLQREQALARLETESLQRYRNLADAIPHMVWQAKPDGTLDYFNRYWCEYTGLSVEQSNGSGWQSMIFPMDLRGLMERWAEAKRLSDGFEAEARIRKGKDGDLRWHLIRVVADKFRDGQIRSWLGTCTDINDQKYAENIQRFLASAGSMLASSLDYQATLEKVTQLAMKQFGGWCVVSALDESNHLGQVAVSHASSDQTALLTEISRRYPPAPDDPAGPMRVVRTGKPELVENVSLSDLETSARDSEHFQMLQGLGLKSTICVPLVARGRTFGVISFLSNERSYNEVDLRLARDMAGRFALAVDNARLYGDSQKAIYARDEFLSIASHELKTPITALKLQLQIQLQQSKKSMDPGAKPPPSAEERLAKTLDVSSRQVERLTSLVENLLDVARIRGGQLTLEYEEVNLASLVQEVVDRFSDQLESAKCPIDLDLDRKFTGKWDRMRLEQVLINLLANSVKYAPGSPIKIKVSRDDISACLLVQDSGPGIEKENLSKIFNRFERATSAKSIGGLGLGLFIVNQIVRAHHGAVHVESEVGQGTQFTVSLPLNPLEIAHPEELRRAQA